MRPIPVIAAAVLLLIAGCGGGAGSSEASSSSESELSTVRMAETVGIPSAFLQYGIDEGVFEEHGIRLELSDSPGGAAVIPGLVSGSFDIGGSNVVSDMLAASRGLPIRMVAPGTFAQDEVGNDFSAILVRGDSPVQDAKGLENRTIAVNTLSNIGEITINTSLEAAGVDPESINYVELGFPDMLGALEAGQVDAVWLIEPFVTIGITGGARPVMWPFVEARPGMQIGSFSATDAYVAENPDVVAAFQAAVADLSAQISADEEAFRAALPELANLEPALVEELRLPAYKPHVDEESLQFTSDQMVEYGLIPEPIDLESLLAEGAVG
jgi:NitT/TauT family transport system substrate-binding protein